MHRQGPKGQFLWEMRRWRLLWIPAQPVTATRGCVTMNSMEGKINYTYAVTHEKDDEGKKGRGRGG